MKSLFKFILFFLVPITLLYAETGNKGSLDWWSFKAVSNSLLSDFEYKKLNLSGRIDYHITQKNTEKKLVENKLAEPHQQIRRLAIVLTGLQPTKAELTRFIYPLKYDEAVDHYLNSPHFGERWARHWMDVVRYAETYGYEWNYYIRNAWIYRDYLIRAFNSDLPYNQFVSEHLAGDLLDKPRINKKLKLNESIIGTAFYRLGETGHDDCTIYPEINLDVMDNQIDTLSKSFQALTVSCSRCHNHKLDPIPQKDYYSLLGMMSSSRQVMHTIDTKDVNQSQLSELKKLKTEISKELVSQWNKNFQSLKQKELLEEGLNKLTEKLKKQVGANTHPLYIWSKLRAAKPEDFNQQVVKLITQMENAIKVNETHNKKHHKLIADFSGSIPNDWTVSGQSSEIGLANHGDYTIEEKGAKVITQLLPAGFYSHLYSKRFNASLRSPTMLEKKHIHAETMGNHDGVIREVVDNCSLGFFSRRILKDTKLRWQTLGKHIGIKNRLYYEWATKFNNQEYPYLSLRKKQYEAALKDPNSYFGITKVYRSEVTSAPRVLPSEQLQLLLSLKKKDKNSLLKAIETKLNESIQNFSQGKVTKENLYWLNFAIEQSWLKTDFQAKTKLEKLVGQYRKVEKTIQPARVIPGLADDDEGFDMPLFVAGNPRKPKGKVTRDILSVVKRVSHSTVKVKGSGRRALADSITDKSNPLTARVWVNRLWQYSFGKGIVKTPNDFGQLGAKPTHPALLDEMARQLMTKGWSTKSILKAIVSSKSFRRSSQINQLNQELDPGNNYYHRYPLRRLEAEVIRDSLLQASNSLNREMYGESIHPHRDKVEDHRKLYKGPLDSFGRRSIYIMSTRMEGDKFLELFNAPVPNISVGKRDRTNVPTQYLAMLNHPFVIQQCDRIGEDLSNKQTAFNQGLQDLAMRLLARSLSAKEEKRYQQYAEEVKKHLKINEKLSKQFWSHMAHTMVNGVEFAYVL